MRQIWNSCGSRTSTSTNGWPEARSAFNSSTLVSNSGASADAEGAAAVGFAMPQNCS